MSLYENIKYTILISYDICMYLNINMKMNMNMNINKNKQKIII